MDDTERVSRMQLTNVIEDAWFGFVLCTNAGGGWFFLYTNAGGGWLFIDTNAGGGWLCLYTNAIGGFEAADLNIRKQPLPRHHQMNVCLHEPG